ncbi:hypothetical protein ATKI12_0770 [Kitasatospora sp. Ki12]
MSRASAPTGPCIRSRWTAPFQAGAALRGRRNPGRGSAGYRVPPSGWTPGRTLALWRMVTDPSSDCSAVPA